MNNANTNDAVTIISQLASEARVLMTSSPEVTKESVKLMSEEQILSLRGGLPGKRNFYCEARAAIDADALARGFKPASAEKYEYLSALRAIVDPIINAVRSEIDGPLVGRHYTRTRILCNELSRRTRNATIAAAPSAKLGEQFQIGDSCEVHAFGHWYKGTVKSINRNGRLVVTYTTGTGVTRDKTVGADLVRKA